MWAVRMETGLVQDSLRLTSTTESLESQSASKKQESSWQRAQVFVLCWGKQKRELLYILSFLWLVLVASIKASQLILVPAIHQQHYITVYGMGRFDHSSNQAFSPLTHLGHCCLWRLAAAVQNLLHIVCHLKTFHLRMRYQERNLQSSLSRAHTRPLSYGTQLHSRGRCSKGIFIWGKGRNWSLD